MYDTLDFRIIEEARAYLPGHWRKGDLQDGNGNVCAHGALLRPTCTPGDGHMWRAVIRHRDGITEGWNDKASTTEADVLAAFAKITEPTPEEMTDIFGPQWRAIRDLVRRAATLTLEEADRLVAARAAGWGVASGAALDAVGDAAGGAARAAGWDAALDAVGGAAAAAAWRAAWAWGAALGSVGDAVGSLVVRDLIGQYGLTQEHYDTLTGPWATAIGPAHPDDAPRAKP